MAWVADELWKAANVCALLQISNRAKKLAAVDLLQHIEADDTGTGQAVRGQIIEQSTPGLGVRGLELHIDDDILQLVGLSPAGPAKLESAATSRNTNIDSGINLSFP